MATFIKPIETRAYGCKFRSRTEARWATFFQRAGIAWEYEPEGYQLSSGWYLPDFRIQPPGVADQAWMEIKPVSDTLDDPRWAELAAGSGLIFMTVRGMHRRGDTCGLSHRTRVWHPGGLVADVDNLWTARAYDNAWDAASSARFDQGRRKGRRR